MNATIDQVLALLGNKEVEIMLLRQQLAQLEAALQEAVKPKPEAPQ